MIFSSKYQGYPGLSNARNESKKLIGRFIFSPKLYERRYKSHNKFKLKTYMHYTKRL